MLSRSSDVERFRKHFTESDLISIFNLPKYKKPEDKFDSARYQSFLEFYEKIKNQLRTEIDSGKGNILDAFTYDSQYSDKLDEMKKEYYNIYLKSIDERTAYKAGPEITDDNGIRRKYPHFESDLFNKGNLVYQKYEEQLDFPKDTKGKTIKLEHQTDEQVFSLFGKRIEGLKHCQTYNISKQDSLEQEYYQKEYERESSTYESLKSNTQMSFLEKIEKMSKTNFYDYQTLNSYLAGLYNMKLLEEILSNPKEELYARTFLPESCFYDILEEGKITKKINFVKVKELLDTGDRNYRQYVFGNYTDNFLTKLKQTIPFLYDVGGVLEKPNYEDNCNLLVNWTLLLDLLYSRCAISNNTPLAPLRFVLPYNYANPNTFEELAEGNKKSIIFNVRYRTPMDDIFDNNMPGNASNADFVGIISIKYYHNQTGKIRVWFLFVFKNNNITNRKRTNVITGVREPFFLCNYRLRHINMYGLFEKHSITHYEILYFYELCKQGKLFLYKPMGQYENDNSIFISPKNNLDDIPFLKDLSLTKAEITLKEASGNYEEIPETNFHLSYNLSSNLSNKNNRYKHGEMQTGGNIKIEIKSDTNENKLFFSDLSLSKYYIEFINAVQNLDNLYWYSKNNKLDYNSPSRHIINKYLQISYPYSLIDNNTSKFSFYRASSRKDLQLIGKYNHISIGFYYLNEIFKKYELFKYINKNDKILSLDNGMSLLEYVSFQNYSFDSITDIITESQNYYTNLLLEWRERLSKISSIYKINNINYAGGIYDIEKKLENSNICRNNKFIYLNLRKYIDGVGKYDDYYNIPLYIAGLYFSIKHLASNGILLFNIQSVAYKHLADIILIFAEYFEKYELYYPDIHSRYKRSGASVLFFNFKGLNEKIINELNLLLDSVKNIYPNEANDFNIHNSELRDELYIYKQPIPNKPMKNIIGFLDYDITDKVYEPFWQFNDSRYFSQVLYLQKMTTILTSANSEKFIATKLPTPDQITSSILYCKKWDIPYFDKYNTSKIDSFISRNILAEMYGLAEPILYNFKTPFKTYIANKIILNPRFSKSSRSSILSTIHSKSTNSKHSSKSKSKLPLDRKTQKRLSSSASMGAFLRDVFKNNTTKSYHSRTRTRTQITSTKSTHRTITRRRSTLKRVNMSLLEPIFPSNNQLVQVGRLIDSRRDFSKPAMKAGMKYDPQTWLYDKLKEQLRYYKGKGTQRQVPNLDKMVQQRLGDFSISQAWLKMYEIISDCDLVPRTQKGTFRSFHICEAPGTFINALNNYIRTKTSYTDFDWMAQSLNPKTAKIADTYGLVERHPDRWDWGATRTGDITQVENIRYYMKKVQRHHANQPINLMTSDCGLPMGDPKYEFVAFASYVAILAILPKGGTMVYKILSPIDLPLVWNLIYITFTNFKELAFFKPVQNSQSREFYIIAKDYLGTAPPVIDKLLDIVQRWSKLEKQGYKAPWVENTDLFNDKYPEEFVAQVLAISERLAQNYVNSIERIIYYVDNYESLGGEYQKHIEKYIEEKNEDWIRRYRPRKLENKWIL